MKNDKIKEAEKNFEAEKNARKDIKFEVDFENVVELPENLIFETEEPALKKQHRVVIIDVKKIKHKKRPSFE